ncbi:MAG: hydantoinase/oxoprolinase N-terminal domain-containing protein [Acidimicrobiia bacterium]
MQIGIDVGGTNTDAVVMDGRVVLGETKTPTTPDVTRGIVTALTDLMGGSDPEGPIRGVMIGTTHFTNAVVEARRLIPTAAVRLALPATQALPPMTDWPERLREALGHHVYMCAGGHEFDGRVIAPLDMDELEEVAADMESKGVRSVAISSVFSPVNGEFEEQAAEFLSARIPGLAVSLSNEIGRIGLLERENATVMNACLRELAAQIVHAFETSVSELGIEAPLFISQNDGTLMSADYTEQYPVATFASGATNSMRGAAFLSGVSDCVVVDIGGTTTDVGMLTRGFPREASVAVDIGGVRTNFRMPDVLSIGLGGGSILHADDELAIGPDSVGYLLTERALVFGGDTVTATDVAVAAGLAEIGDGALVADLDQGLVSEAVSLMQHRVSEAVDQMKTDAAPLPVVLVGGGSILVGDKVEGASQVIRPDHFPVANAIGAAIAQVGGETDQVFSLDGMTRERAIEEARSAATARSVEAGADPDTVKIVDVEEVPLAYLPSNAVRIRVKAVGNLRLRG